MAYKPARQTIMDLAVLHSSIMVLGWLRPSRGRPSLPESTQHARRGEYDAWEPLGRLLLPKMHQQADEILKARKEATRNPPPPQSTMQTQSDISEQVRLTAQPDQSSTTVNNDIITGRDSQDQSQGYSSEVSGPVSDPVTGGGAGLDAHSRHAASRPASSRDNSREHSNGGTDGGAENATPTNGARKSVDEDDNSGHGAVAHPENREQPNRQNTPPPSTNNPSAHAPVEQTIAAYYEEPLPIYTRYPEPIQRLPPADPLHSIRIFCANCDPQAQVSRHCLLSDYLCGTCWVDFVLWRSN